MREGRVINTICIIGLFLLVLCSGLSFVYGTEVDAGTQKVSYDSDIGAYVDDSFCYTVYDDGTAALNYCRRLEDDGELIIPASVRIEKELLQAHSNVSGLEDMAEDPDGSVELPIHSVLRNAFTRCAAGRILIPEGIEEIGTGAFRNAKATEVQFPESLKKIGNCAFQNCNIKRAELKAVETLEGSTFYNCGQLESVVLPDTLVNVSSGEFCQCDSLTELDIPGSIKNVPRSFVSGEKLEKVILHPGTEDLGMYFIDEPNQVKTLSIPVGTQFTKYSIYMMNALERIHIETGHADYMDIDGVVFRSDGKVLEYYPRGRTEDPYCVPDGTEAIGKNVFENHKYIRKVVLPKSVINIGENAFQYCSSLEEINLDNVREIGGSAFMECRNLSCEIRLRNCSVGYWAFMDDPNLQFLKFSGCEIGDFAFKRCGIQRLEVSYIPNIVSVMGVFEDCTELTELTFTSGVSTIGQNMFKGCTSLKNVDIPETIKTIEAGAFEGCTSLESVRIPEGIQSLGYNVFEDCTSLKEAVLPETITRIPQALFDGCSSLQQCPFTDSVVSIGVSAFRGCTSLTKVRIPEKVQLISSRSFENCVGLTEIILPAGLTTLGGDAFAGCSSLAEIHLPDGITNIGDGVFARCTGLQNLVIPETVETINTSDLFDGCSRLTCVKLPDSTESIGSNAFRNCTALEDLTIPGGVTSIGSGAFRNCTSLTSLRIPGGVTKVGIYACAQCENLMDLYFEPVIAPKVSGSVSQQITSHATNLHIRDDATGYDGNGWENQTNLIVVRDLLSAEPGTGDDPGTTIEPGTIEDPGATENSDKVSKLSIRKPGRTHIKSLKRGKKSVTIKWKRVASVTGYIIQYSTSKKFGKKSGKVIIKSAKNTKKRLKGLKKKKYYIRIRTYKTVKGKKLYSKWSKVRSVKIIK